MLPDPLPGSSQHPSCSWQFVPIGFHAVVVSSAQRWQSASPRNRIPPNQVGQHPTERPTGAEDTRVSSHQQMAMASHPTGIEPGSPSSGRVWFLRADAHCTHAALTGSLVFDEEEFQPLLEGVFIHIELNLHPVGKAPEQNVSGVGRLHPESSPGAPSPHPSRVTPRQSSPQQIPGSAVPNHRYHQPRTSRRGASMITKDADVTHAARSALG